MAQHWVGTWTVAPAPAENVAFNNITLRMNGRVSLGGKILRVRLSNAHGTRPLTRARLISACAPTVLRSYLTATGC